MSLINSTAIPSGAGYKIDQSLRAATVNSGYLNRTPSASNRKTFTWSFWVKRANEVQYSSTIVDCGGTNNAVFRIAIDYATGVLRAYDYNGSSNQYEWTLVTNARLRDFSAWYNIIVAVDTTQGTNTNRAKVYINGVDQVGNYVNDYYPAQNYQSHCNTNTVHKFGGTHSNDANFEGYFADVHFIDGAAKSPADFGETGDYGEWKPIEYEGSYGTNGFYLNFATASDMGDDKSGNTNDWNENGIDATDQVLDTPTNNFATLNPLDKSGTVTLSEGSLKYVNNTGVVRGTIAAGSGSKFYLEYCQVSAVSSSAPIILGIGTTEDLPAHESAHVQSMVVHCDRNNQKHVRVFVDKSQVQTTAFNALTAITTGGILMFAYDGTTGKAWVGINGSWLQGNPATGANPIYTFSNTDSRPMTAFVDHAGVTHTGVLNFGQDSSFAGFKTAQGNQDSGGVGDFFYTPPNSFLALCSKSLPNVAVVPSEYFNTVLYSGNSTNNRAITGVGFAPDFIFSKARSTGYTGSIYDRVRGAGRDKHLAPSETEAEGTANYVYGHISAFGTDGYTLSEGADSGNPFANENESGTTYVSWNWKAGNATLASNAFTQGSLASTCSRSVEAGFSIVSYTGNATSGATVGHGLSSAPDMVMVKRRSNTGHWEVYHSKNTAAPETDHLRLSADSATGDDSTYWNDTAPTSSVFSLGNHVSTNENGQTYIAYCFHSVEGYSKFGTYDSNASTNGPFVYLGFQPKFVIAKGVPFASDWTITDNEREEGNPFGEKIIFANATTAESTYTGGGIDFTSNGFKVRSSGTNGVHNSNSSGNAFIYLCFAKTPFKYSNAK